MFSLYFQDNFKNTFFVRNMECGQISKKLALELCFCIQSLYKFLVVVDITQFINVTISVWVVKACFLDENLSIFEVLIDVT